MAVDKEMIDIIQQTVRSEVAAALSRFMPPIDNNVEDQRIPLDEAAKFLGLTRAGMYQLNFDNKIPFTRPNGKKCYYLKSDLLKYLSQNQTRTIEDLEVAAQTYLAVRKLKK